MQPVALEATTAADLHGAVAMLTDDERSDAHAAAMRFLERHGPDAAA